MHAPLNKEDKTSSDEHLYSLSEINPEGAGSNGSSSATLSSLKKENRPFLRFLHKHLPWLFDIRSLFYLALIVFIIAMAWTGYSLITNHFTQLYGWDYSSQYVTFYYDYYDMWKTFFTTGKFVLWDNQTFLGSDNIGSNSYYGLFDPFVVALVLFPRSWIPQMTAFFTLVKIVVSFFCMRAYLRYLGIKEGTARFGALAYAFCGYMNFMVGFPSFVSGYIYIPLILLGIERTLKEKRIGWLVFGLFLEGITNFFFLVMICIFGVIYAIWRYFQCFKTRTKKDNIVVIPLGIAAFAIGLMLCSFSLLPSLRESSLSGRSQSIGSAYLAAIIASLKTHEWKDFFALVFQEVGGNTGRELQGLISFFYPTSGYIYLPLAVANDTYRYDAWTASIFCYTPFVILFFDAIFTSIHKKKISHFIAILLCCYLLFTNFAYFFFFAFSGNGYGRWYILLEPLIIYYGCWAFDQRGSEPRFFMPLATVCSFLGTIATYFVTVLLLQGKTFTNDGGFTYFIEKYFTANETTGESESPFRMIAYVYYQAALVVIEGFMFFGFRKKKWLPRLIFGCIAVESIVAGNMSFVYGSSWPLEYFNGGQAGLAEYTSITTKINEDGAGDFYRVSYDEVGGGRASSGEKNFAMAVGSNGTATFHSLLNFNVYDYAVMAKISGSPSLGTAYGATYSNPSWSGYYGHKRQGADTTLGIKYYVIEKGGYPGYESENVPFGSVELTNLETRRFRVFRNDNAISLGYAVPSENLYRMNYSTYPYSDFYDGSSQTLIKTEDALLNGAIFDDDVTLPEGFETTSYTASSPYQTMSYSAKILTTADDNNYLGSDKIIKSDGTTLEEEGPGYIINHYDDPNVVVKVQNGTPVYSSIEKKYLYTGDYDHVVLYPKSGWGDSFNTSDGAYFSMYLSTCSKTRIYMIGDTYDEDGHLTGTNQTLNYEFRMLDLINTQKAQTRMMGFYATGKVKYIVFCAPSGSNYSFPGNIGLYMREKASIDEETAKLQADSLQNVVCYSDDEYTFSTSYAKKRIVVTQLAYDEGWQVSASGEPVETFRLDGGFLGFVAPAGETSYKIQYVTPYLKGSSYLFAGGLALYFAYAGYQFVMDVKAKKRQMDMANFIRPGKKKPSKSQKRWTRKPPTS